MTDGERVETIKKLRRAIATLKTQRETLGDAVVEAALGPMREQLQELEEFGGKGENALDSERKVVTVMFADLSGLSSQSIKHEPEEMRKLVNACYSCCGPIIDKYGGTVEKFIGDEILAIFGAPVTHENDPERAIRTALAILDEADNFYSNYGIDIGMRVGVSTGMVIAGGIGTIGKQQYGVTGDCVNLAKRLQEEAPIGGTLISHDTYRHVRGIFQVQPQAPIQVKGKLRPVQTYLVKQTRPHAFHAETRGVEGVETRLVAREAELLTLKNIYLDVIEDNVTRIVTFVGEVGVGKSRLLYEFEKWIESLPEDIWIFKGRAAEGMQTSSYYAIRSMFSHRFDIQESDRPLDVMHKFRYGMAVAVQPDQADLVGHLMGFNFPLSHGLENIKDSKSFRTRALALFIDYLRKISSEPAVIFLEDMQWADESSLDLLDHLAVVLPKSRLLVVCQARPALYDRRPGWGEGREAHIGMELKALSRRESRMLVNEILQKVEDTPVELRDLIVNRAEGNPFYIEELIKMLIDSGVIRVGEKSWWVEMDRLTGAHLPSTLAGVIQARLDSLPSKERAILQRASVVGRQFWDAAVAELVADEADCYSKEDCASLLETIRRRELIFQRETSTFVDTKEYIFKHALMRDVIYDTVLLKKRRTYHSQVATWLEAAAGERLDEYLGLIAGHFELADDQGKSIEYLLKAGDKARLSYAHQEAEEYYQRALVLMEKRGDNRNAARTLMKLGLLYHTAFDYQRSRQAYDQGFVMRQKADAVQTASPLPSAPHPFRIARANPSTLDPTMADDSFSSGIINQLFSGLVEGRLAMETIPDVARSWELSQDGQMYTFHLRDDVYWSDGIPVSARDFEYAWKRVLNPVTNSPNASLLYDIKGARIYHQGETEDPSSLGVRAINDLTLVVELEGPTGYFLSLLAHYATFPIPRHALEIDGENWTAQKNIITNGAFKIETWERDTSMSLSRNLNYHRNFNGNLQEVEIYFDVEWSDQFEMYKAGDLDLLSFGGTPDEKDHARQQFTGEYFAAQMLGATYLGFDVSRPPFDNPHVRQAFALATDKKTLANVVLRGYETPASGGFIPPGVPGHTENISPPYNPEQARMLMAEAGYPGGRKFPRIDAWTWQGIKSRADYLQSLWGENLGIDISWDIMDFPQFITRIDKEPTHLIQTVWMPDYPDPDACLRTSPIKRRTHWQDQSFERLVEKARRVLDQASRLKLYTQAERILVKDEAVIIPLTYMWSHLLVKPWVRKLPTSAINEWLWKDMIIDKH